MCEIRCCVLTFHSERLKVVSRSPLLGAYGKGEDLNEDSSTVARLLCAIGLPTTLQADLRKVLNRTKAPTDTVCSTRRCWCKIHASTARSISTSI